MATRARLSRLVRQASHALASPSAASSASGGPSLQQCRSFARMQTGAEVAELGSRARFQTRRFQSMPHKEDRFTHSVGAESGPEVEEEEWEEGGQEEEEVEEWEGGQEEEEVEEWEGQEEEEEVEDLEPLSSDADDAEEVKAPGRGAEYAVRIEAPVDEIYSLLHSRGFITEKQKRPQPNDSVLGQEDHRIVSWYRRVSLGLLNFYSCCDNFLKVKAIVNYQLRWSAIHTLSKKHKSSSRQVILKYGKNLVVTRAGELVASFLSVEEIKRHRKGFLEDNPVPPDILIDVLFTRMKRRSREEKKKKKPS